MASTLDRHIEVTESRREQDSPNRLLGQLKGLPEVNGLVRVQFTSYDVTGHLDSGHNALGVHLGNGFYAGDKSRLAIDRHIEVTESRREQDSPNRLLGQLKGLPEVNGSRLDQLPPPRPVYLVRCDGPS
jgi:hypothetical protein